MGLEETRFRHFFSAVRRVCSTDVGLEEGEGKEEVLRSPPQCGIQDDPQ